MSNEKFYITTPIFYANGSPHLGHAYVTILADVIARYHRWKGEDVYFLAGVDEHGIKNLRSAEASGMGIDAYFDSRAAEFRGVYDSLESSYDQFIRTTDKKLHWPAAQALWQKLADSGDIYKGTYEGLYCVGCEAFKQDKDLIDGKCPDHGTVPERLVQENYFFKLSKYTDAIKKKIESNELRIVPEERKNEILSLISEGLEDVSFSRPKKDLPWGIPVPGDDSHVMYVWCDALVNYISALGYAGADDALFKKFWPADLHVLGKDILRFHAAIWPGMLLSAGVPLPKAILVHGLILSGGRKMSKTMGNVIDPKKLIEEYGVEALRFYLAHEVNPFEDGDVTEEKFKEVYNAYLANGIGNLTARVMKMSSTYLDKPVEPSASVGIEVVREFEAAMDAHQIQKGVEAITKYVRELDLEIQETQPFKTIKTDPEKAKEIVTGLVQGVALIGRLLAPIMPQTSAKISEAVKKNTMPTALFARKD